MRYGVLDRLVLEEQARAHHHADTAEEEGGPFKASEMEVALSREALAAKQSRAPDFSDNIASQSAIVFIPIPSPFLRTSAEVRIIAHSAHNYQGDACFCQNPGSAIPFRASGAHARMPDMGLGRT